MAYTSVQHSDSNDCLLCHEKKQHVVQYQGTACLTQLISAQEHEQLHQARHAGESFHQSTARKLPVELVLPRLKPCTANARTVSMCTWTQCCRLVWTLATSNHACAVVHALGFEQYS